MNTDKRYDVYMQKCHNSDQSDVVEVKQIPHKHKTDVLSLFPRTNVNMEEETQLHKVFL